MPQPRKVQDQYFKKAKAEGYVARSAYKLQEIDDKFRILPKGGRVLDLGCAPGAWLQVAAERTGPKARIVGVDLQEVRTSFAPTIVTIQADAYKVEPARLLEAAEGAAAFDTILSDMAPNTTGHGDDLLSARLCRRVLELLPALLRPGGNFAMKVLEGSEYPELLRQAQGAFAQARGFKPKSSREVSREMYIVGTGYRRP